MLGLLIVLASGLPVAHAGPEATTLVLTINSLPPGCASGVHLSVAALPGQPVSEADIRGCSALVFTKPALADVQIAIVGGDEDARNTYFCDWRPLAEASCVGAWIYQGEGTTLQMRVMSGGPGAVTATGA